MVYTKVLYTKVLIHQLNLIILSISISFSVLYSMIHLQYYIIGTNDLYAKFECDTDLIEYEFII